MDIAPRQLMSLVALIMLLVVPRAMAQIGGFPWEKNDTDRLASALQLDGNDLEEIGIGIADLSLAPDLPTAQTEDSTEASSDLSGSLSATNDLLEENSNDGPEDGLSTGLFSTDPENFFAEEVLHHPIPTYSSNSWLLNGDWYARQDLIMLLRSDPRRTQIGTDRSLASLRPVLFTTSQSHYPDPGARLTIGRLLERDGLNRDQMLEFTYWGGFDWATRGFLTSFTPGFVDTIIGPVGSPVPGFDNADSQNFVSKSELDSFEINLRIRTRPGRDRNVLQPNGLWIKHSTPSRLQAFSAGLRYMGFHESFLYQSRGSDPLMDRGDYRVLTNNRMLGFQFGGELTEQHTEWNWGVRARAGALVNFAGRRSRVDTIVSGTVSTPRIENIDDKSIVFLGEVGLFVTYQLTSRLALRTSYDAMYLNGIALATENLGLEATFTNFNIHGASILQGLSFGVEMVW